jgi:hypothetical protein
MAVADSPRGRPAAHVGVLQHRDQRVGQGSPAPRPNRPPLPKPHYAVVRRNDLADLRVVESSYALHIPEQ